MGGRAARSAGGTRLAGTAILLLRAFSLFVSGLVGEALAQGLDDGNGRRVALVLGNGAYQSAPKLRNPPNDAQAMAVKLRSLGFEVVESVDADQRKLREALTMFADKLEGAAAGLFFYAGHGLQVAGQNYLIPIEAKLEREADLYVQTVTVADVLRVMEATVPVRLVFLDACRDNPLARRLAGSMGSARSQAVGQGLAKIDAAVGTLIAYATAPGDVAEDGDGTANSPFTTALLQHLDAPGLEVSQVLKRVRGAVLTTTKNRQVPWDSSSLVGDFYFKAALPQPAVQPDPALSPSFPSPDRETVFWQSVHPSEDASGYEEYLRQFPKGLYAGLARNRVTALKQQAALVPPQVDPPTVTQPAVGTYPDLSPGKVFRDCPVCPEMVVVPAGSFTMGSPSTEEGRFGDEGPQHRVSLRVFAVGRFEVTFAEWDACVAEKGCSHRPEDRGWGRGRRPVMNVSWNDIRQQYLPWLRRKTGEEYRLLTESEWEYAARAGTDTPFSFGPTISPSQANYDGNYTYGSVSKGAYRQQTVEVGSFAGNAFGLHDMHGNVWEWVDDPWHASYSGAPNDGSAWLSGGDLSSQIVRGGSWYNDPRYLRAAIRIRFTPDDRNYVAGFRVARTLTP